MPNQQRRTDDAFLADCRARVGFDVLARTWTAVVVFGLRAGPRRPGRLRQEIGGISTKVLTETLRRLERDGLVERRRYAEAPPRVEYGLTAAGRAILGPIEALAEWSLAHGDEVLAAQDRYDGPGDRSAAELITEVPGPRGQKAGR